LKIKMAHICEATSDIDAPGEALVRVRHRMRSWQIEVLQFSDLEPCRSNALVHFAIQVTPACNTFPQRREAILPGHDSAVGRTAVFDKNELPAGLKHTLHLLKRAGSVRDGAEGPCDDDCVHTRIGKRQGFLSGLRQKVDINTPSHPLTRHLLELKRRVHSIEVLELI